MEDHLNNIRAWDLFHSYGKFNILYEIFVENLRECNRGLIHKHYETKKENKLHRKYRSLFIVDHDDIPENLWDRPLKIILSELPSDSLIKCLKGLLFESRTQGILAIGENEVKSYINPLFKKMIACNELRNKIIHSTSHICKVRTFFGRSKLNASGKIKDDPVAFFSRKEKVSSKGLNYETALYSSSDFDLYNEQLEKLNVFMFFLKRFINSNKEEWENFDGLTAINFTPKHKSHSA